MTEGRKSSKESNPDNSFPYVSPPGMELSTIIETHSRSKHYNLIATNVTLLQVSEFLTLNPSLHSKNILLRNGNLLVLIEEFIASPIHNEIMNNLFAIVKENRNAIDGVKLFAKTEVDVTGSIRDLNYADVGILTADRRTNRRLPCVLIEISYSSGLEVNINRIVDFMKMVPEIGCGYVIAIRCPWTSQFDPVTDKKFYSLNNGTAICVSIMRKHEAAADPTVTDIISFGKTALSEEDIKSICDITMNCFAVEYPPNEIRGNVASQENVVLCNEADIPDYQLHIPGEVFLVDHWVEEGLFAQAVVEAVPDDVGELVIDLFQIQESMDNGVQDMNGMIARGTKNASAAAMKW